MLVLWNQVHIVVQFTLCTFLVDLAEHIVGVDIENVWVCSFFWEKNVLGQVMFLNQHSDFTRRIIQITKDTSAPLAGIYTGRIDAIGNAFLAHITFISGLIFRFLASFDKGVK